MKLAPTCLHGCTLPHVDADFLSGEQVDCPGPMKGAPTCDEHNMAMVRDVPRFAWRCPRCGRSISDEQLRHLGPATDPSKVRVV